MSKTTFSTSDALTKKAWEEKLFRDSVKQAYFTKFEGSGSDSIIQTTEKLSKDKGDEVTIGLRVKLSGAGVTEGQMLEGNEEKLNTYNMKVLLKQYRHAVRDDGEMSRKRSIIEVTKESEMALKDWMTEKIDQLKFDELGIGANATVDPTKIFYRTGASTVVATGTAATAKTAMHATNSTLSLYMISFLKTWAQTGGGRTYIPIRPIKVEGGEYFVLLCHNDALFDLRASSEFQTAQREAQSRGKDHPLFQGAVAIWDQVVIHAHENCYTATDGGGASVPWSKAIFMGQQAGVWAWGKRPEVETELFDYKNEIGNSIGIVAGVKKSKFNSLDYGSVGVYLSRTNVSGV